MTAARLRKTALLVKASRPKKSENCPPPGSSTLNTTHNTWLNGRIYILNDNCMQSSPNTRQVAILIRNLISAKREHLFLGPRHLRPYFKVLVQSTVLNLQGGFGVLFSGLARILFNLIDTSNTVVFQIVCTGSFFCFLGTITTWEFLLPLCNTLV